MLIAIGSICTQSLEGAHKLGLWSSGWFSKGANEFVISSFSSIQASLIGCNYFGVASPLSWTWWSYAFGTILAILTVYLPWANWPRRSCFKKHNIKRSSLVSLVGDFVAKARTRMVTNQRRGKTRRLWSATTLARRVTDRSMKKDDKDLSSAAVSKVKKDDGYILFVTHLHQMALVASQSWTWWWMVVLRHTWLF